MIARPLFAISALRPGPSSLLPPVFFLPRADFGDLKKSIVLKKGDPEIFFPGRVLAKTKNPGRQLFELCIPVALFDLSHRDRWISPVVTANSVRKHPRLEIGRAHV